MEPYSNVLKGIDFRVICSEVGLRAGRTISLISAVELDHGGLHRVHRAMVRDKSLGDHLSLSGEETVFLVPSLNLGGTLVGLCALRDELRFKGSGCWPRGISLAILQGTARRVLFDVCVRPCTDPLHEESVCIDCFKLTMPLLGAQNLGHGPSLGQFVDQLIQIPDFLHRRLFNVFDPNPTNHAVN